MSGRLDGKVAVITGGASGMGRATTLLFLSQGARVVIGDMNETTAKETLELAADAGRGDGVRFIRTDVASEPDVEAMIRTAVDEFGRLDIVYNNAGVGGAFGSITQTQVDDWNYTLAVLLTGPFLGMKHGARVMREQGDGGAIISTASVAGLSGGAGPQAYSAAKAGLINLTRAAAVEFASDRIRVNCICPGGIMTPLVARGADPETLEPSFQNLQPLPLAGRPEHIANAALFLASDESAFVTGEALVVDGGLEAAGPRLFTRLAQAGPMTGMRGVSRGTTGEPPLLR